MEQIKYGCKPTKSDHRDYDFCRTLGASVAPVFPPDYDVDAHVWMPSQYQPQSVLGGIPAFPYGCTSYTMADIDNDLSGQLQSSPVTMESVTHANERGGLDVRSAFKAAQQLKWIGNYFNIRAYSQLDWFDSIRYAILSGGFEKRSVSWGCPWFSVWGSDVAAKNAIMSMPDLSQVSAVGWHNSKFTGWKTINDIPYLVNKSWQGNNIGDGGLLYFSREVVNAVMTVNGTCALTAANYDGDIKRVSLPVVQMILSYLRNFIGLTY